ncbi:MAG: TIR domain-containing protein [Cyanobacteria bacterium P01_E01_bin.6]
MRDFFISYNRFDKQWAEWIAWILEDAEYSVFIQAWDFRPGGNFVIDMQKAAAESKKTIAVLSETYLKSAYTQPEWAAAFVDDPSSLERKLIPVKVKECKPEGLLKPLVYVDLIGISKEKAKQRLLESLEDRVKPEQEPDFPGVCTAPEEDTTTQPTPSEIDFPPEASANRQSAMSRLQAIKAKNLERHLSALEDDYNAAFAQMNASIDDVTRGRLERRIQMIEKELDEVAEKLENLSS